MNLRNIDLNLLHIFVVVYDCRSITDAAHQLHLSQPAVSNAITRLNNSLELTLFIKKSRHIHPTRQADSLYKDIKCCLQSIETCLSQQMRFDPATSEQTFRIATSNFAELALFPKLIPYLQESAPNIKISREFFPKPDFGKHLYNGRIDLVIFLDHAVVDGIQKEFLFDDELVLITSGQYPPCPDKITLADIAGLDLIGFGSEYEEFASLQAALEQYPAYRPPRVTVTSLWSAFFMVSKSTMAAIVPKKLARVLADSMHIRIHRLTDAPDNIRLNLYWRDLDTLDAGHTWFRELIKKILNQEYENCSS